MGGSHGKEPSPSPQPSPLLRKAIVPPPTTAQTLQALLQPSRLEKHTLDRTLKGFLKHCNLTGLEYRLRIAGVYSLEDLVLLDEIKLSRRGFTRLMAKRLFTALDEYLLDPDEIVEPPPVRRRPSELIRHKPQPFMRASTLMRSRDNYGKMNLKRSPSSKLTPPPRQKRPVTLRTPTDLKEEFSFAHNRYSAEIPVVVNQDTPTEPSYVDVPNVGETNDTDSSSTNELEATPTIPVVSIPKVSLAEKILTESPAQLEHSLSIPAGLQWMEDRAMSSNKVSGVFGRFCTSCPSLFYIQLDDHAHLSENDIIVEALAVLKDPLNRIDDVVCALYMVLDFCKEGWTPPSFNDHIELITQCINNYLQDVEIVEVGCRVLKYLTYRLLESERVSSTDSILFERTGICILNVLKVHSHSQRAQLNGCLILANILRADPNLVITLLANDALLLFYGTLQAYQDNEIICLAVLNALASTVASAPEARQVLVSGLQTILTETAIVMNEHISQEQVQKYALSFITLALIDVAAQLDTCVMRPLLKAVLHSMSVHIGNINIVIWGCKALSQMTSHELIQDQSVTESIVDILFKVLLQNTTSSGVQMWSSYALYQLVCFNRSLLPLIQDTGVIEQCQKTMPHLSHEAQSYLKKLTDLATL